MGKHDDGRNVFPITTLQIGDLQSYLSDLSIFLALESNKFYILVDNQPCLSDLGTRPALLWQLMVTKSRLSPFAITKGRRETKEGKEASSRSNAKVSNNVERWLSCIHAEMLSRKKELETSLLLTSEVHRTLHGFIVFEVAWSNVRGINYYNELQTDTSLAIEAKFMKRWEFDSIDQAARCISSWFSGTGSEQHYLKEHLMSKIGEVFYDVEEDFPMPITYDGDDDDGFSIEDSFPHDRCDSFEISSATVDSENFEPHASAPIGLYNRRKIATKTITGAEVDVYCEETRREAENSLDNSNEATVELEATEYRDVLILFRFDDRDLPFKLKQIITPDLRLLRLLEAGLPSWALFLQSYPGLCHIYRPWMCPLARALYVLISIITVLIGFFDLYKNVPLLKATASHLCGPLLDWIENWEMVTRIKYLGTMLFLQNFEKAMHWLWVVLRASRSFFNFLNIPLAGPLMEILEFLFPIWHVFSEVIESLFSIICIVIGFIYSLLDDLMDVVLMPIWFIGSVLSNIATSILYPMFWILWGMLYAPIRLVLALASFVANVCAFIIDVIGDVWESLSSMIEFASEAEATVSSTQEVSMWQSLWSDLLSQAKRLGKTKSWVVALKCLMLVLRVFQDGDPYFPKEVLHAMNRKAKILNLPTFRDESTSSPCDYTAFVKSFASYLQERLDCFLTGKLQRRFTFTEKQISHPRSRRVNQQPVRHMKPPMLLDRISYWQRLLDKAISTTPTGSAKTNRLVLVSFYAVVRESFDLYRDISNGLGLVLDGFFHLQHQSCVSTIEYCVKGRTQFEQLSSFYENCKRLAVGRTSDYPSVHGISEELLETLKEFVKDHASFPSTGKSPRLLRLVYSAAQDLSLSETEPEAGPRVSRGSTTLEDLMKQEVEESVGAMRASCSVENFSELSRKQFHEQDQDSYNNVAETGSNHSLPIDQDQNVIIDFISFDEWPTVGGQTSSYSANGEKVCRELALIEAPASQNSANDQSFFDDWLLQHEQASNDVANGHSCFEDWLKEDKNPDQTSHQLVVFNGNACVDDWFQGNEIIEPEKQNQNWNNNGGTGNENWELVLVAAITQPSDASQPSMANHLFDQIPIVAQRQYNPFLEDETDMSAASIVTNDNVAAGFSMEPIVQATTPTFFAQIPNGTTTAFGEAESDNPFAPWPTTKGSSSSSVDQQNILLQQPLWLQ